MTGQELLFFSGAPDMLPVYAALAEALEERYPALEIKVGKTQISFRNRRLFAMASLPLRRGKGWPRQYLLVSFGLSYQKESPRVAQVVEAYPNRWTHHVITVRPAEIDGELLAWIDEAYRFAMEK